MNPKSLPGRQAKAAEPTTITSLTFNPPAGSNLQRAVAMAEQLAIEYPNADIVFYLGAMRVVVTAEGVAP